MSIVMPIMMTLKLLEVVSETTRLKKGWWRPINQGITANFEHSREVSRAEAF